MRKTDRGRDRRKRKTKKETEKEKYLYLPKLVEDIMQPGGECDRVVAQK